MAARVKYHGWVYTSPICASYFERSTQGGYLKLGGGRQIVVYELSGDCARILPAPADAWLERADVEFEPSQTHSTEYVAEVQAAHDRWLKDRTPTACAVVLRDRPEVFTAPGEPGTGPGASLYRPVLGTYLVVFRQEEHWVQTDEDVPKPSAHLWLRSEDVALSPVLPEKFRGDWFCYRKTQETYRAVRDNAYHTAPGSAFEIKNFFKAGESIHVTGEHANGWLRTSQGWVDRKDLELPRPAPAATTPAPTQVRVPAAVPSRQTASRSKGGGWFSGCLVALAALGAIALAMTFRKQLRAFASAAWVSVLFVLYDLWIRRRRRRAQAAAGEKVMRDDDNDEAAGSRSHGGRPQAPRTPAGTAALSVFEERPGIIETKIAALIRKKKLSIVQEVRLAEIKAETELKQALTEHGRSQEELEHYSRPELANARRTTTGLKHELEATEAEAQLFEAQQKLVDAKRRAEAAKAGSQRPPGPKRSAAERMFEEVSSQEETARELWKLFEEQKIEWEKLRDAGTISKDECQRRVENLRDRINRKLEEQEV